MAGAGFCLVLALVGVVVAAGGTGSKTAGHQAPTAGVSVDSQASIAGAPSTSAYERGYHPLGPLPPTPTGTPAPSRSGSRRQHGQRTRYQPSRFQIGRTIARYRGTGSARQRDFQVRQPGDWGISWQFSCPKPQSWGFTIRTGDAKVANRIELTDSGPTGHGISWTTKDPGTHSLIVITRCSWEVQVVLPKRQSA